MAETVYPSSSRKRGERRYRLRPLLLGIGILMVFPGFAAVFVSALVSAAPYPWDPASRFLAIVGAPDFGLCGLGIGMIGAALIAAGSAGPMGR